MKPIILVILSSAMFMPMMHQPNNTDGNTNTQPLVQQAKGLPKDAAKKESEATMHAADFITERLQ